MKKVLTVILCLAMVLALSACGAKTEEPAAAPAAEKEAEAAPVQEVWPKDPITIIVGQKAGGTNDLMARGIADHIDEILGVPVVVENVEGGSGMVAMSDFLNRDADGLTIMTLNQPKLSNGYVIEGNDYSLDDLAFLSGPQMDWPDIAVPMDSQFQTTAELIDYIKANPGKLSMGVMVNTGAHYTGLILIEKLGLDVHVVTYEGGNDYRVAMAGGHVDFGFGNAAGDYASFRDSIRPLAICSNDTLSIYSDVPLVNDELKPYGVELPIGLGSFRSFFVRSEVKEQYPERYQVLVDAFKTLLTDCPEYDAYIEKSGEKAITTYMTPEETFEFNHAYEETIESLKDQLE